MNKIASIVVGVLLICGCDPSKEELHVFNWSDYVSPEVVASFEAENNCKVIIDAFDSNEAMYAKLKAGAAGYDIVVPSSYQVEMMAREGMLEELELSKISNATSNFAEEYQTQVLDTTFRYSFPYVVTYTGFIYLKDKASEADVSSWAVLGNQKFRGKISLLDDIREVIGIGLMYNGYSLNSTNAVEISKAVETVLKWKKNIRKFDSESYRTEVPAFTTWVGHGYSSDSTQLILGEEGASKREDIAFALPKEGFTIAWDELVILKTSKHKKLAYKFINHLFRSENALENMKYVCGVMAHKEALKQLPQEMKDLFIQPPEVMKNGQVMRSFADSPEVQDIYNKAWDKIKAIEKD